MFRNYLTVTLRNLLWHLVGISCLTLWSIACQGPTWEGYNAAGKTAYKQGHYLEAEKQFLAALEEAEKFGSQDSRLATSLNNLALLYQAQGKYVEAEPLSKRALGIVEKALGPDHPDVVTVRNNLQAVEVRRREEEQARKSGKVRLTMAVVSLQTEAEALLTLTSLKSGTAFQGQDMGFILPSDLDPRFADVIKGLKVGEMSRVVKTEKGYFVFKRTE